MKKNILIVDDHPIVSTGLQALIEHTGEYGKIYVTNNITSSRLLLRQKDIDIAIIDLELQDANGMELIKYIHQTHINTKILVYTMHEELWTIRQLMKEDADAIVMKGDNPQEVLIALRKIEQGKGYFSQQFRGSSTARTLQKSPCPTERLRCWNTSPMVYPPTTSPSSSTSATTRWSSIVTT